MEHAAQLAVFEPALIIAAAAVMWLGGFVKGAIGFALPTIALTGLGSFLTAQEAVALLILPTLATNLWQTLRQGWRAAGETLRAFWKLNLVMSVTLAATAQLVPKIPAQTLFLILGIIVSTAAVLQLVGWRPVTPEEPAKRAAVEVLTGIVAGIAGGLSGVWGPPVLFFLLSIGAEKRLQVRMQGIAFLLGSIILVAAHLQSGVLNEITLPVSALMIVPAMLGMALGFVLQDRMAQDRFRKATLAVLTVAGLNLLRRGLF